jgi:uncharacterized membrane protein YhaH (DUF805 family)
VLQTGGLIWLLFGYRGRISRSQFWMAPAIYLGGLVVSLILSAVFSWLLFVIFFGGLVVSALMVCIKRLHDRNKGDWWAILFFIVPMVLNGRINDWSLGSQLGETGDAIVHLVATAISIWGFIELGCLRGTRGTNAYGPDPLGARAKPSRVSPCA